MADEQTRDTLLLLQRMAAGDDEALRHLFARVYDELRRLARRHRRRSGGYETINTTALVHEAFIKLTGLENPTWEDRAHFFRVASRAMRSVLVDYARRKQAAKRSGDRAPAAIDEIEDLPLVREHEVLGVHEALDRLAAFDPRQGQIVELRYFVGLSIPETAEVLGLSPATVKRDWVSARAWLLRELSDSG
jgi:RNA polymerase sigma factor (TIGR02999 family)